MCFDDLFGDGRFRLSRRRPETAVQPDSQPLARQVLSVDPAGDMRSTRRPPVQAVSARDRSDRQ